MRRRSLRASGFAILGLSVTALLFVSAGSASAGPRQGPKGLSAQAFAELSDAGGDKYVGAFTPATSEELDDGWVKHTFDTDGGNGPICIAGTPFTVFTRARNPAKLLIFEQGGGACWQDFYFCNILADDQPPTASPFASGIWVDSFDTGTQTIANPLADWSVVYVSYCDGSVFSGDNDVVDASFPFGAVRFHRGLRNATAAIDLAKATFPHANRVLLAGSSAGGVGVAGVSPFLVRFVYGNNVKLRVFNDAGPVAVNLDDLGGILARASDWQFGQFFPASCTGCDPLGQAGPALIEWRLDHDNEVREAFYSTDGDATDRFFLFIPTQEEYRELIVTEHGALNDAHPERYKRFIRSGDDEHTALQRDTFYLGEANGVPLYQWTDDFINPRPFWVDIVEDFVPIP